MVNTNFAPFPTLTTERLLLRALEATDAAAIFAHRSDPVVNSYVDNFRHSDMAETEAFIERIQNEIIEGRTIMWAICEQGDNRFLGTVCFWNISPAEHRAEAGYTLDPAFHGRGYMHEALAKIIGFGFAYMKLETIDAYTHEHNTASSNLLRRNGFVQGTPRKDAGSNRVYFCLERASSRPGSNCR